MPGKLIIHIGLHKTATSHLQINIFPRLDNCIYLHGNNILQQWSCQEQKTANHCLISYEGFSGKGWNQLWIKGINNEHSWLKSFDWNINQLKKFFPDASIIVLFRNHADMLFSMYKQYIQEGGRLDFDSFYGVKKVISPEDLSYRHRIDLLRKLFPEVYFLNYEDYKKEGDKYIQAFFKEVFNLSLKEIGIDSYKKRNVSISGWKIEFLRRINPIYNRIPKAIRGPLRYFKWSPRDILQIRLSFINPMDSDYFSEIKQQVNDEFMDDWAYFLKHQWIPTEK